MVYNEEMFLSYFFPISNSYVLGINFCFPIKVNAKHFFFYFLHLLVFFLGGRGCYVIELNMNFKNCNVAVSSFKTSNRRRGLRGATTCSRVIFEAQITLHMSSGLTTKSMYIHLNL